ncbi:ComF family protein [Candidatus Neoehrlichia procyonis]|uniref:Phosphoribosyl transferase domain protein n=1 Tax=Candidatus Neoehrlichia procyonis str. RAC413 TaxID=1359163 RepID=A0A0F3NML8_9RICK|nr:ComF family protein [Candidatus Neoehrlichia lotoris]KJV69290.1 phosphoribosyl transferase domain protein [Candidatus Neoehrlichia lotoris str. RAC413]
MILSKIIDLIFPQTCINCRCNIAHSKNSLCNICENAIDFLNDNYCTTCGTSLQNNIKVCTKCSLGKSYITNLESVFAYNQYSKNIILNFKFFDDLYHIKTYAKWMYTKGHYLFPETDIIVPIPLHKRKLLYRKYNQAALLANSISKLCKLPVELFALKRIYHTTPLYNLSINMRRQTIKKSFKINNINAIQGKKILLVDDVVTTGITIQTCAKKLIESGAKEVKALTLSRTLRT